jgi:hypothetical protein
LLFKALKQTAKVKSFLGTSANAVKTQIWTVLIAMLILKYLQMKSSFGWSLSNLAGTAAPVTIHFQGLMGVAQQSAGGAASRKATGRTVAHAPDLVDTSWTAEEMQTPTYACNEALTRL